MLRYTKSLTSFLEVLKNKKFELITLLTLSGFFIFIAGIMLYVFEGNNQNPNIKNLFDAFYWALITISTVGYGDISPITPEGRVVTMLIIFTGIGLISFATSIIVSSFSERLTMLREDRIVQNLSKKESITVICGFGLLGRLVAKELQKEGVAFVVIEKDETLAEMAYSMGYKAICADATNEKVFAQLKIATNISHVLSLTSDDIVNIFIAVNVKSLNPKVHVSARCSDEEVAQKMYFANVDQVIMPEEIAGMMAAVYEGEPVAFEVLLSIVDQKDKIKMDEIEILEDGFGNQKTLKEIDLDSMRVILLGVLRNCRLKDSNFIFNPDDDFLLQVGDNLVCIGHETAISNLKRKMQ
jgi:voltage-gated potassium channel